MKFNVNDYVNVKLTKRGHEIINNLRSGLSTSIPTHDWSNYLADTDGWLKIQLWRLMELFGPHMGPGAAIPFETTIELLEQK